jgi:hypothetical protein
MMGTSNSVNVLCANKYNILLFATIGTMVAFTTVFSIGGVFFIILGLVAEITMGIGVVNRIPVFFIGYDKRADSILDVNFKKFIKIK